MLGCPHVLIIWNKPMNTASPNRRAQCLALALICLSTHQAPAALIPIANAGFESPVTPSAGNPPDDWVNLSGSGAGGYLWNINDDPQGLWTVPAPEGRQVLFVASSSSASGIFSQVLTSTIRPDTVYTLTGYAGSALGSYHYIVSVLANGQHIAGAMDLAPPGSFVPFSITFDSRVGNALAQVGQPMEIQLRSIERYAAFDDLRLQAVYIPEPTTLLLAAIALTAMQLTRRRKNNHGSHGYHG